VYKLLLEKFVLNFLYTQNGVPAHQNMQVQKPHQMSSMGQSLHLDRYLDHMSAHHQHLSIPIRSSGKISDKTGNNRGQSTAIK
jgi:hypothetical protein